MEIVRTGGVEAVSFRVLAKELGVTPMAVRYHVGSRDQMIADLIEQAFADIALEPPEGTPGQRLRHLLLSYCDLAVANSKLVQSMLQDPAKMPDALTRFTDMVRRETRRLNDGDEADVMLNLVIDYIHGFVFVAAAAPAQTPLARADCARSLDWLLEKVGARDTRA